MPSGPFYHNSLYHFIFNSRVGPRVGVWLVYIMTILYRNSLNYYKQCRVLRRLISVCAVYQCPFYGMQGLNGLSKSYHIVLKSNAYPFVHFFS